MNKLITLSIILFFSIQLRSQTPVVVTADSKSKVPIACKAKKQTHTIFRDLGTDESGVQSGKYGNGKEGARVFARKGAEVKFLLKSEIDFQLKGITISNRSEISGDFEVKIDQDGDDNYEDVIGTFSVSKTDGEFMTTSVSLNKTIKVKKGMNGSISIIQTSDKEGFKRIDGITLKIKK